MYTHSAQYAPQCNALAILPVWFPVQARFLTQPVPAWLTTRSSDIGNHTSCYTISVVPESGVPDT